MRLGLCRERGGMAAPKGFERFYSYWFNGVDYYYYYYHHFLFS